jgi:hypothetical protein
MKNSTQLLLVGIGATFLAWYVINRGRAAAKVIATKANPVSRENVVYQATGEVGTTIADWFGGLFKSDAEKAVDRMLQPPATVQGTTTIGPRNSWDIHPH